METASQKGTSPLAAEDACSHHVMESVCGKMQLYPIWKHNIKPVYGNMQLYPIWKHNIKPVYGKMQLYPIWKHNIKPEYSFQQIEPTGKSSDVLNIQWHFLKKCPGV